MTHLVGIGNYGAEFGTEPARAYGYEDAGCTVSRVSQEAAYENGPDWFLQQCRDEWKPDAVTYARTHNNTALGHEWNDAWAALKVDGVVTFTTHLDLFHGLPEREGWVESGDPMFRTEHVFTADGSCPEWWAERGVNHHWLPPGCDDRHIPRAAEPFPELAGRLIFVGSTLGYHPEYPGRLELIAHCRATYGERFIEIGNGTVWGTRRGYDLARVYASDAIFVGDSCFAGKVPMYWSDRIPETLGRGGFLIHPYVPGIRGFYDGSHLATYEAGNFEDLDAQVGAFLANPGERDGYKERGRALVMRRDTYRHRAREVLDAVGIEVPNE